MRDITQFYDFCDGVAKYLELRKPYEIRIKSKSHSWAAGFCEQHTRKGRIVKHVITIYIPQCQASEYDFYSIIAHEFIHAWQAENDLLDEYHGAAFQNMATEITNYFWMEHSINLIKVYSPETDIDE